MIGSPLTNHCWLPSKGQKTSLCLATVHFNQGMTCSSLIWPTASCPGPPKTRKHRLVQVLTSLLNFIQLQKWVRFSYEFLEVPILSYLTINVPHLPGTNVYSLLLRPDPKPISSIRTFPLASVGFFSGL